MNAAAQRRLTPVYAALVAVFGLLWLLLLSGVGRGVAWHAPRDTPPLPAAQHVPMPALPPLQQYAPSWEHPLFSSDRKPIVSSGGSAGVSLGDLQLTGIILTPTLHMALLGPAHEDQGKDDGSGEVRVREGAMLPDGNWKLIQVLPRSAVFASSSGRTELNLPAGAPITQQAGPGPLPPAGPAPMPRPARGPDDEQAQRLRKLRDAILKQRSQANGNAQGDH